MIEQVVNQAIAWGFPCQQNTEGNWYISPKQQRERWQLSQSEERWLLSIDKIPQLYLVSDAVLTFLQGRNTES